MTRPPTRPAAIAGTTYWKDARAPRYTLLLAIPLLLAYEALAAAMHGAGSGVRNGADVVLQQVIIAAAGPRGPLYVTAAIIALCVIWLVRDMHRHGRVRPAWLGLMLLEAVALSVVFGFVVAVATAQLLTGLGIPLVVPSLAQSAPSLPGGTLGAIMLSLGAGLYEELLFRVLLVSAIAAAARHVLGLRVVAAGIVASVVSAIVFSLFHHVGPYGEPFTIAAFTFRAIAGLAFSGLFLLRGFGITAWTHALYDVWILAI